jgi:hypothetical protein
MLLVFFWGPYDGVSTNVQGAVFYPLLGTLGILIPDNIIYVPSYHFHRLL